MANAMIDNEACCDKHSDEFSNESSSDFEDRAFIDDREVINEHGVHLTLDAEDNLLDTDSDSSNICEETEGRL